MSYHVGLKWRSSDCLILFFLLLLSLTFLFNCIYIVDATLTMMEIPLNMNTSLRSLCWFKVICVCKFNIFFESGIVRFINPKTSTTLFGYLSPLTKIVLLSITFLLVTLFEGHSILKIHPTSNMYDRMQDIMKWKNLGVKSMSVAWFNILHLIKGKKVWNNTLEFNWHSRNILLGQTILDEQVMYVISMLDDVFIARQDINLHSKEIIVNWFSFLQNYIYIYI